MGIGTVLKRIWRTDAREPIRGFLTPEQIKPAIRTAPIEAGRHYVRLYLRRLYLPYQRIATATYHAALVAELELVHDEAGRAEFKTVIAPPELAGIPKHQRANMKVDTKVLAGPVPYRGETLSLTAGLLAVESQDLAGPFLATLESLARAAGVNYVAAARPFIEPLGKGMALLAEAAGKRGLKIGVDLDLPAPQTGLYTMIDVDRQHLRLDDLTVMEDFTLHHPKIDLRDHAHFLLSLEASTKRDDYLSIPDIKAEYDRLRAAVKEDRADVIQEHLRTLRRLLVFHADLLETHAEALYEQIKSKVDLALAPTVTRRAERTLLPSLDAYDPFG